MKFEEIHRLVGRVPFISKDHGRYLYNLVLEDDRKSILELGIAHGTATCYMAAALQELGGGQVTAVDLIDAAFSPSAEQQLSACGLGQYATVVRMQSGYNWFLHDEILRNTSAGRCKPVYDLCIIDGPKNWTIDGAAFFFVDKLLRRDAWLIFDDYDWTYAEAHKSRDITDGISHRTMSQSELETPQIREIFELLVKQHPSYGTLKVLNETWCMAQKNFFEDKHYSITFDRTTRDLFAKAANRLYRRFRS